MTQEIETRDLVSRSFREASRIGSYQDAAQRPYVHLVDGSSSDNLGLRLPLQHVLGIGGVNAWLDEEGVVPRRRPGR